MATNEKAKASQGDSTGSDAVTALGPKNLYFHYSVMTLGTTVALMLLFLEVVFSGKLRRIIKSIRF